MADTPPPAAPRAMPSRFGIGTNVLLQVLLGVGIVIGLNALSARWYDRRDLSVDAGYTLSSSTDGFLRKLSKEVEITVLISRLSQNYGSVQALLEEYRRKGHDLIKTEFVDPVRDRERVEQIKTATKLSLQTSGLLVRANGAQRFIKEEELVILSPGVDKDHPVTDFRGEDAVTSAILGLMEGTQKKFGFITGKGARAEAGADTALAALQDLGRQQNFQVLPVNLGDPTPLPPDLNGLILIGPKYDFTDTEFARLKDYWSRKRAAMLVLLDPESETPHLDAFLKANGVTPRGDRVLYAESTSAGPNKVQGVLAEFSKESPITRPFKDASAKFEGQTQSLALANNDERLKDQLVITPLLTATARYWGETRYLDPLPVVDAEDTKPPVFVAASVERGAVQDERLRVESARLIVVSNPTLLDPATRLAVNQDFIAASLNWMLSRERLIGITPKRKQLYRVLLTPQQRELLFWITALCTPALVLAIGLTVWARRRAA